MNNINSVYDTDLNRIPLDRPIMLSLIQSRKNATEYNPIKVFNFIKENPKCSLTDLSMFLYGVDDYYSRNAVHQYLNRVRGRLPAGIRLVRKSVYELIEDAT